MLGKGTRKAEPCRGEHGPAPTGRMAERERGHSRKTSSCSGRGKETRRILEIRDAFAAAGTDRGVALTILLARRWSLAEPRAGPAVPGGQHNPQRLLPAGNLGATAPPCGKHPGTLIRARQLAQQTRLSGAPFHKPPGGRLSPAEGWAEGETPLREARGDHAASRTGTSICTSPPVKNQPKQPNPSNVSAGGQRKGRPQHPPQTQCWLPSVGALPRAVKREELLCLHSPSATAGGGGEPQTGPAGVLPPEGTLLLPPQRVRTGPTVGAGRLAARGLAPAPPPEGQQQAPQEEACARESGEEDSRPWKHPR